MPQIPNKRGRPRKYGSKEEKARQDVIARRARRRLQSTAAREDTRFKIYTTPNVKRRRSASLLQQKGASTHRSPALELSPATRTGAGPFAPQNVSCDIVDTQLRSPESMRVGMLPSCDAPGNAGFASLDDGGTYSALACQPEYAAGTPAMNEDGGDQLLFGNPDGLAGANTEMARSEPGNESENESGERQQDGELQDPTQDDQGRVANLDYQSEDGFEADSDSQSDNSDTSNFMEVDDHLDEIAESNHLYAKEFLEKTWDHFCDCREEENMEWGGRPVLSLEQMAEYWKTLGVPDSISPTPPATEADEEQTPWLEWSSILSGGDNRPNLDIERSQSSVTSIDRTWDIDSIFSWASCLSINRGLYVSYHSPISRNISSNVHLFHQGKALHLIPHLRLGSGRQSPQLGVYVFFPGISHALRTTSYLTNDERRLWIDRLLLPAIRRFCPPDILQHHPRSFDDVESKAHSRRRELCSGIVQNNMDMHHYLPQQYLEAIWRCINQSTEDPDLVKFRGMFIVVSAKNIKLEAKSSTLHECRSKIITHLHQVLDWSKADLSKTWIDIGLEDIAAQGSSTFLFKSRCLEFWIDSLRYSHQSPLVSSERFNWNLTGQAGSARVEIRRTHPLRKGGIAYAQRYNVNKDLFATAAKRDQGLFGEPQLEGLTCPPSLLDAWIVAARQYRNAGTATALKAAPQLKRLRKAFESMKARIRHALDASTQTSFGVREEYRISWKLFMAINPYIAQPSGAHRPYWVLPTAHVNKFMRWEFNRWLSAIDFVRARGSRRDADWEVHQRNMIMATILIRSLKASVNCHHVAKRSQMFKDRYVSRQGRHLRGLDFARTMHQTGLAWLPRELFNWHNFHLHDELVTSTTFTFNGLQCVFRNWRDVNSINREYSEARELEFRLRGSEPDELPEILDRMRKMIYRHLALQVIRQTCTAPDVNIDPERHDAECWQGHYGLSYDILRDLRGEPPRLSQARKGRHGLGNTYPERVKGLFDWDDGIPRTFWDHCYYRQLCRRFYRSISNHIGINDAQRWKSSLGTDALRYFWIIPHYDRHSLFTRLMRQTDRSPATRPFISGLYQWRILDTHVNLCSEGRWLFGGSMYLDGRPESLVRQDEADCDGEIPEFDMSTYEINLGRPVPFTNIPRVIEAGFKASWRPSTLTDPRILAHYKTAHECLARAIGHPLCDLLMIIVLTLASSTVTPALPMYRCDFEAGTRKNPELFAATLATRMLWFLYPEWFPWEKDKVMVLRVPEMVKRMEQRGVNNRILCKIGWVVPRTEYRENPWNSDLRLRPEEELLDLRAELLSLMNDPPVFIERVFQSDDDIWVERCFSIIAPKPE